MSVIKNCMRCGKLCTDGCCPCQWPISIELITSTTYRDLTADRDLWRWRYEQIVAMLEEKSDHGDCNCGICEVVGPLHAAALKIMAEGERVMPKWIPEECGKIVDETGAFLGRANSDADAAGFCDSRNADIDALEAEIAELRKLVQDYQRHGVIIDDMEDRERDAELAAANATLDKLREENAELKEGKDFLGCKLSYELEQTDRHTAQWVRCFRLAFGLKNKYYAQLAAANATLDKLREENVALQWKAKESEIAMLEAQQSEDYWKSQSEDANATLGNERAAYAALLESHELILDALTASDSTLEKLRDVVPTDRVQCTKCPSILDAYYLGCGEFKCEDCEKDFSLFDLIDKLRAILYPPTETNP